MRHLNCPCTAQFILWPTDKTCLHMPVLLRSYTLASLLELADISLPEDFGEDELEVAITGLQNRPQKVLH